MINRLLKPLNSNSFFLFGARATGKSTYINEFLKEYSTSEVVKIDLLQPATFNKYFQNPSLLYEELKYKKPKWCFIDEVQKIPELLNVAHMAIFENICNFILTGSSARKLKKGGANLLAGRAFLNYMYPLTHQEIDNFNLQQVLEYGALPKIISLEEGINVIDTEIQKKELLYAYVHTYLKEEIAEEQLVRKIDPFRRFLPIAGQMNGEIINFTSIAKDLGISTVTVQSYFQILEDTLIGIMLPAYHVSVRKQQKQSPKFYLFDLGVARCLTDSLNNKLLPQTFEYGIYFEQFIILEIIRLSNYKRKRYSFSYIRTKDDVEIDLVIERPGKKNLLVEIKSTKLIKPAHLKNLNNFSDVFKEKDWEFICISQDEHPRKEGDITVYPWRDGITKILDE